MSKFLTDLIYSLFSLLLPPHVCVYVYVCVHYNEIQRGTYYTLRDFDMQNSHHSVFANNEALLKSNLYFSHHSSAQPNMDKDFHTMDVFFFCH